MIVGTAEAEAPILWPYDAKSRLIGKDPDLGKMDGKRREWLPSFSSADIAKQ